MPPQRSSTSSLSHDPAANRITRQNNMTSPKILKALTTPAVAVSPLMTVFFVQTSHIFFNAILLSPCNPLRGSYWKEPCTNEGWILNWFAFAKLHLALLLGFLGGFSPNSYIESKLGCLSFSILIVHLLNTLMLLRHFNVIMAGFQAIILLVLMLATLFWMSTVELRPGSSYLASAFQSRSISQSQRRHKIAIPTLTLSIQAVLSSLRVIGIAFGSSVHGGYLGDTSSDLFENISSLTLCDAMLVPIVMIFALFFCPVTQHRSLLYGQAVSLFLSQIILASSQADMMDNDYVKTSMVGTFSNIVLSVAGSM